MNSENLTQYKLPTLTLSQLKIEISNLDKYWQELAETRKNHEQHILTEKIETGVQELTLIAEKINRLANEIKNLMFNFKDIAVEVNRNYHLMQQTFNFSHTKLDQSKRRLSPLNIWDIHSSTIPIVVRRGAKFILTKKKVDLFNP